jgi:hypothetical protein
MSTLQGRRSASFLRHTHVSQLIAAGLDVVTVSRRIGHGNPTATLGVYSHLLDAIDERAISVVEAALPACWVNENASRTAPVAIRWQFAPDPSLPTPLELCRNKQISIERQTSNEETLAPQRRVPL